MTTNDDSIVNQIKAGNVDLAELEKMFSESADSNLGAASGLVTVTDWGICFSSATGQLSQFATVTSNSNSNPITGLGMLAYSANGSTMFCLQYNNGYSDLQLAVSSGTALYTSQYGNQALCVIYGWTQSGSFYIPQTMTIESC
jgi:hypothetical protein